MSPDLKRRRFLQLSGAAAIAAAWLQPGARAQTTSGAPRGPLPLDLAEWTQGYVGLETTQLPRGEMLTGKYISVEVLTPRQRRAPYPVIFVPGGTSQGLDWLVTADGRRGWALLFVGGAGGAVA